MKIKKLLSMLLALALVFGLLPTAAFAITAAAQAVSMKLSTDWKRAEEFFAPALMLLMLYYVTFFSFTVFPPRLGLFKDPLTGGFGVRGAL